MKTFLALALSLSALSMNASFADRGLDLTPAENRIFTPDAVNVLASCEKQTQSMRKQGFQVFHVTQKHVSSKTIDSTEVEYTHQTSFFYGRNRVMGSYLNVESLTVTWKENCLGHGARDSECVMQSKKSCTLKTEVRSIR